ncbi:hypothetical protein BCR36DRAFT_362315 [Piromyces finnis]|uniref:Coth-domain-containing protein n=1 Tax=Piromyces finnis TaxID=1754191 RepID=A0A1Y1UYA3_9FUNG|nr:hypothetical protein BCR36DRAFT_362315 [Piromyces finnis]|eukprot:ORX42555.1 hypothetical protein BCR36DRAFT_362315 [Piromyces finnis]
MKTISSLFVLFFFFALGYAKNYKFNVVSILGENSFIGVKYGNVITPLTPQPFPLFSGLINADKIEEYKYVELNSLGNVVGEESLTRTYSDENSKINEVYNRSNKNIKLPELPKPFQQMFPMGSKKYQPLPNVIYNVYAKCDEAAYKNLSSQPFLNGTKQQNDNLAICQFTIISPENVFQTTGSIHVIGYGSRLYKKLSWTMKFDKKFLGRKAIKMRAMANDPSLIREKFASELYKSAGIPVQECTYARFFINGDNYGLYTMLDSLNRKWIKNYIHGNSKADIGFAYKLDSAHPEGPFADFKYIDENYLSYRKRHTYKIDEYEEDKLNPMEESKQYYHLVQFIKLYRNWVVNYGNDFSDKAVIELEKFFNIESMLRVLAVESLTLATDNFFMVMSNSDLYYNPEKKYYQILPFDFDRMLCGPFDNVMFDPVGYMDDCITWVNYDESHFDHYFTNNLLKHPQIKNRYDVILAKISRYTFDKNVVARYIHAVADFIREDVQWNFELNDKLTISYNGIHNHFTVNDFENNLVNRNLELSTFTKNNITQIDLMQFIEMRGDRCRAYTSSIDLSKNKNHSFDIDLTDDVLKSSGVSSITKRSFMLLFTFTSVLLFFMI